MLPALVQASAKGIEGLRLTILGGSQGVNEFTTGLAAPGSIYTALQSLLASGADGNGNGRAAPAGGDGEPAAVEPAA